MSRKKELAAAALAGVLYGAGNFVSNELDRADQKEIICIDGKDPKQIVKREKTRETVAICDQNNEIVLKCGEGMEVVVDNSKISFLTPVYKCEPPAEIQRGNK